MATPITYLDDPNFPCLPSTGGTNNFRIIDITSLVPNADQSQVSAADAAATALYHSSPSCLRTFLGSNFTSCVLTYEDKTGLQYSLTRTLAFISIVLVNNTPGERNHFARYTACYHEAGKPARYGKNQTSRWWRLVNAKYMGHCEFNKDIRLIENEFAKKILGDKIWEERDDSKITFELSLGTKKGWDRLENGF